jgi:hypothetical protein
MDFVNIFEPRFCKHSLFSRTRQHHNRGRNSGQPKRGTARFCSLIRQATAPAFVPLHTPVFFQSRQASRIRFVFPKRRSSRRREHCQGGGSGGRGHDLDKRSGAIHSPAANTKPLRSCERFARQRIFARLRWPCAWWRPPGGRPQGPVGAKSVSVRGRRHSD